VGLVGREGKETRVSTDYSNSAKKKETKKKKFHLPLCKLVTASAGFCHIRCECGRVVLAIAEAMAATAIGMSHMNQE
jgi:hypothetical protein